MKTRKLIGIVLMLALPLAISANMIWVPDQAPTLEVAVDLAMVGDTVGGGGSGVIQAGRPARAKMRRKCGLNRPM